MHPILLTLGSFELRAYGVIVAMATLVGLAVARREAIRRGVDPRLVEDFAFIAIIAGLLGARVYYVLFFDPGLFIRNPLGVLAIWQGGLAIHGALIGGIATAIWFCRRHGLSFWVFADTLAPALILGQAVGRLACLLNGDAYGIPTSVPWAITFTDPAALAPLGIPLHPTQIYEMGLDLLLFAIIWAIRKRHFAPGQLFLIYAGGYGAIRFVVEAFRGDQLQYLGGLSAAQTLSAVVLAGSALLFWALRARPSDSKRASAA